MRWPIFKKVIVGVWLTWCLFWFGDGVCLYTPSCAALLSAAHVGERTMVDVLVLMLSGFPSGMYVAGFLGDYVVGAGKFVDGLIGYVLLSLSAVVAGYFQWFVLLPWLWRKLRAMRERGAGSWLC